MTENTAAEPGVDLTDPSKVVKDEVTGKRVLLRDLGHITTPQAPAAERGWKDPGEPVGDDVLGQMATGVCRSLLLKCVASLKECESVAHHGPDCAADVAKLDDALASLKAALAKS